MNRERIIYVVVLLAVFGGVFAVYQFYFSAKLERYAQHRQLLESLREAETSLKSTFGTAQPEDVIRDHKGKIEAWNEALDARIPFFSDEDWREHEKQPEDVFILQFWYGDETQRMITELWENAQAQYGAQVYQRMPDGFPTNIHSMFNVAHASDWQGRNVTAEMVSEELERLSYGISAMNLLMDNKALKISLVGIEELGPSGFIGKAAQYVRVKLSFMMEAKVLVDFLDSLRQADSYYSVEGMRISHPYVLARYEPQLNVDMYLLRTKHDPSVELKQSVPTSAQAGYEGNFGGAGIENKTASATADGEKSGGFAEKWRWFKRNVLYLK